MHSSTLPFKNISEESNDLLICKRIHFDIGGREALNVQKVPNPSKSNSAVLKWVVKTFIPRYRAFKLFQPQINIHLYLPF